IGFGTTTPQFLLTAATSTGPQLVLVDSSNPIGYALRSVGGSFFLATSSYGATSSQSVLSINGTNGAITFNNSATSTFNNGINFTTGCITYNGGGCIGSGTQTAASSSLLSDNNTFSGNNLFTASTTFAKVVNLQNASTSLATFGSIWLPNLTSSLLATDQSGK